MKNRSLVIEKALTGTRLALHPLAQRLEDILERIYRRRRRVAEIRDGWLQETAKAVIAGIASKDPEIPDALKAAIGQSRRTAGEQLGELIDQLDADLQVQSEQLRMGFLELTGSKERQEIEALTLDLEQRKQALQDATSRYNREVAQMKRRFHPLWRLPGILELAGRQGALKKEIEQLQGDAARAALGRGSAETVAELPFGPGPRTLLQGIRRTGRLRTLKEALQREQARLCLDAAVVQALESHTGSPPRVGPKRGLRPAARCASCQERDRYGERFCSNCGHSHAAAKGQGEEDDLAGRLEGLAELNAHLLRHEESVRKVTSVLATARGVDEGMSRVEAGLKAQVGTAAKRRSGAKRATRLPTKLGRFAGSWKELDLLVQRSAKAGGRTDDHLLSSRLAAHARKLAPPEEIEAFFTAIGELFQEPAGKAGKPGAASVRRQGRAAPGSGVKVRKAKRGSSR